MKPQRPTVIFGTGRPCRPWSWFTTRHGVGQARAAAGSVKGFVPQAKEPAAEAEALEMRRRARWGGGSRDLAGVVCATAGLGVCSLALLAAIAEGIGAPQAVRIVLGIPLVLFLPGFAAVCAVLPGQELSWGERMLASLGASVAISVCVSVLLAATPIGLSRGSAAAVLGIGTVALALYARVRTRRSLEEQGEPRRPPDTRAAERVGIDDGTTDRREAT